MNIVMITGRLARDPELKCTKNGTSLCEFTLGVDSGYGDNKKTNWPNFVAWGKTADFLGENGAKGKEVVVKGELETGSYENSEGKKVYWTKVNVQELRISASFKNREDEDDEPEDRPSKRESKTSGKKKESSGSFDDDD